MKPIILPFYSGQKVICVKSHSQGIVIKDKKYIVHRCFINCCGYICVEIKGVSDIDTENNIIQVGETIFCEDGKHKLKSTGFHCIDAELFAPIQEQKAPLITFKEILKTEKKEILISN